MPHIDYFFSTLSPYAYLAGQRLEEIAAKLGGFSSASDGTGDDEPTSERRGRGRRRRG